MPFSGMWTKGFLKRFKKKAKADLPAKTEIFGE
jgi:hypothetical protein